MVVIIILTLYSIFGLCHSLRVASAPSTSIPESCPNTPIEHIDHVTDDIFDFDAFRFDGHTLGFSLKAHRPFSKEAALQFLVKSHILNHKKMIKKMDGRAGPNYMDFLGCAKGQTPHATAILVVQNFDCPNLWHTLANHHGIWLLTRTLGIEASEVTQLLPTAHGKIRDPPSMWKDVSWRLFTSKTSDQTNCFERLVWIAADYRPGPWWSLKEKPISRSCKNIEQISFQKEYLSVLPIQAVENPRGVCYLSRELVAPRRHFTPKVAKEFDDALKNWNGMQYGWEIIRLAWKEGTPLMDQIHAIQKCAVLFGPHGAGFAHMFWIQGRPLHVLEFSKEGNSCPSYYGHLASWLGHKYICFNELENHGLSEGLEQSIKSINIPLFMSSIDSAVSNLSKQY